MTFLFSFVHSCHLLLISSASLRSLLFLSFIAPILAWNVPLIPPIFLKRSLVFLILLFSSSSLHCSFKKAFLCLLAFLWNSAFCWVYLSLSLLLFTFLHSAICKASSDNHFVFLHFFFGMVLVTTFCTMLWTSVHSFSGSLSYLVPWMYSSRPLYNHSEVKWKSLSGVQLFATPWTIQSMEFSRPEYWYG